MTVKIVDISILITKTYPEEYFEERIKLSLSFIRDVRLTWQREDVTERGFECKPK